MSYEVLAKFPCYGCKHACIANAFIPIFKCMKRQRYVKKYFKQCKDREDGDPSDIRWYELQRKLGF